MLMVVKTIFGFDSTKMRVHLITEKKMFLLKPAKIFEFTTHPIRYIA